MGAETAEGGNLFEDLFGEALKSSLGGSRSTASSSTSSSNVSVNPNISVVTNGGQVSPSSSGYASGSPSSNATATPSASAYGEGNIDSVVWPAQNMPPVGDDFLTEEIMGFPMWGWGVVALVGGYYALNMKGGK